VGYEDCVEEQMLLPLSAKSVYVILVICTTLKHDAFFDWVTDDSWNCRRFMRYARKDVR